MPRSAGFLTAGLIFAALALAPAQAQEAAPAAPAPGSDQLILNHVYGSCMKSGKLGAPGGELEANCRCEAEVTATVLTPEAKAAMADGSFQKGGFKGHLFTVDQQGFNRLVIKSCPGVYPVLMRQICDPQPDSDSCARLKSAMQGAG